ncbi:hypothetical protein CDV31_004987 [Fusarium ambrosium]|uniref:Uncharacterized protein n=1 Tax=Fusarium ambrosium TaxID=131363 RepID=A0A428UM63_9HYPO|nr:hypothetical protein CDV31_004987 [Fusarium ambrosium]
MSRQEYGLVPLGSENSPYVRGLQYPDDQVTRRGEVPFDYDTAYAGRGWQGERDAYNTDYDATNLTERKYTSHEYVSAADDQFGLPSSSTLRRNAREHAEASRKSQLSRRKSMIWHLVIDLLLVIPALAFLLYAGAISHYDGRPLKESGWRTVSTLYDLAKYGPTIFPIVFAAIATNLLTAVAAWKLEQGISVLSLEYLLRSRTTFSAITSPLVLKSVNLITPVIIIFWALSPLGGQAALRVLDTVPNAHKQPWNCSYLEVRPELSPVYGADGSVANSTVIATFAAALATPPESKEGKLDIWGNVKIPMIEPYLGVDVDKWFTLKDSFDVYSSLVGLPVKPLEPFHPAFNYTFRVNTSYITTSCTANNRSVDLHGWWDYVDEHRDFSNGKGLIIETSNPDKSGTKPRLFQVTSYQPGKLTNVFCELGTTFVEVEIECHHSQCGAVRIRYTPGAKPSNLTFVDDLQGAKKGRRMDHAFLQMFVNMTEPRRNGSFYLPSPMELYLFSSDEPYAVTPTWDNAWNSGSGKDWERGYKQFPKRFTQLLNTFWIASLTPLGAAQFNKFAAPGAKHGATTPAGLTATGHKTSNERVLAVDKAWLAMLYVASFAMFLSALAAAALGVKRRGPDILDYATTFIRDNPYSSTSTGENSMEDGADRTYRLRNVRLCIGDVKPDAEEGYVAIATVDKAVPLGKQGSDRRYM